MSMQERPISILGQSEKINERVERIIKEMMAGVPVASLRDFGPLTPVDIQEVGDFVSDEQLFKWAEEVVGAPLYITEEEKSSLLLSELEERESQIADLYLKLDEAYQKAKVFLWKTVGYEEEEIQVRGPGKLDSRDALLQLLRKIRTVKGDTKGLDQSMKYCRLVKATIATFESIKHDALFLESMTLHLEKALVSKREGEAPLWETGPHVNGLEFWVLDKDEEIIVGVMSSRSKEFGGVILRFLTRAEADASVALKDGTGVRIIIGQEKATRLVPIIIEWLLNKMKVERVVIENEGYFSEEQKREVSERLETVPSLGSFDIEEGKPNRQSAQNFKTLKILGRMEFSDEDASIVVRDSKGREKPISEISAHSRKFEIQFLADLENENEKGENNHFVYDAKKLITARTRLDGWCGEESFEKYVNDASKNSGIPVNEVRQYILGMYDKDISDPSKEVARQADVVELFTEDEKSGRRKKIYVDFSVYERWKHHGIVGKEIFDTIKEARKWHSPKPKDK